MPSKFPWSKSNRLQTSEGGSHEVSYAQPPASPRHELLPTLQHSPRHVDEQFRRFDHGYIDVQGQSASSTSNSDANIRNRLGHPLSGSVRGPQVVQSERQDTSADVRENKKTGLRSKLGLGHSVRDTGHFDSSKQYSKGLGRSASIKRKDNISIIPANGRSTDQISLPNQVSSGHSSVQLSPALPEQDKVGLDPFLVQSDQSRHSISLKSTSSQQSSVHHQPEQFQSVTSQHLYTPSRSQDFQGKPFVSASDRLVRQTQQNSYDPYNQRDSQQAARQYNNQAYQQPRLPDHQLLSSSTNKSDNLLSPTQSVYVSQNQQHQAQDYHSRPEDYSETQEYESFYDIQKKPPQHQQRDDQIQQHPRVVNQLAEPRGPRPQSRPQSQSRNPSFLNERTSSKQQPPAFVVQDRHSQAETGSSESARPGTASDRTGEDLSSSQRNQSAISTVQSPPPPMSGVTGTGGSSAHKSGPHNRSATKMPPHDDSGGRQTPSELPTATDLTEEEISHIAKTSKDYRTLRQKYDNVKHQYFARDSQVQKLQNTIANLQMSLYRTSLDDNEYAARFSRLDGLIAQLAFSIRKSWKSVPNWMQTVVNKDATSTGKQEMTAVGRAFISSWLVEEIFNKHFHPDLEPGLSLQLKSIHRNLRKSAPLSQSSEEEEVLNSKIISWRLATLDGLQDQLQIPQENNCRRDLIDQLHVKLMNAIKIYLSEPAPPDLDGGVNMIVDLAIKSICIHLPCESRELQIEYFRPGSPLQQELMKVESGGIPALSNPSAKDWDRNSGASASTGHDSEARDSISEADTSASMSNSQDGDGKSRRNVLSNLMSRKSQAAGQSTNKQNVDMEDSQAQQAQQARGRREDSSPKVRLAVSLAVKVEGRSVLLKSSVYST